MRTVKRIHKARYSPVGDLITYSPLPSETLEQIDPFIFLNHHGPQVYKPGNNGLPFGPHPHRGMETVTFILEGDISHKDSHGHESVITKGGVQWMTAGRGLLHAEVSSDEFKKKGGNLEILQLWINLPSKYKMTDPAYTGFREADIPRVILDYGKVKVNIISDNFEGYKGAMHSLTSVGMYTIELSHGGTLSVKIPAERNIFFYVVRGEVNVNGKNAPALSLVEFLNIGEELKIEAAKESYVILGHALPYNEPVVAHGPFVMNTMEEIKEAYNDFRAGKFGTWEDEH